MELGTNIIRGIIGIAFLLLVCYLLSADRKRIDWGLVIKGVIIQFGLGIAILHLPFFKSIFRFVADFFVAVLDFTRKGSEFLFGNLISDMESFGYIFAFQVLPTIVFFSALSSFLYYIGFLQIVIKGFAWLMSKAMRLSGAESLAAAANVFIGQTEAPLIVKPYLEGMSRSEILCLMTGGMATIAGGVFAAYVGFLGGTDPEAQRVFATHLLTASMMSAPAAIVAAKMLFPEVDKENLNVELNISKQDVGTNALDAISNGTTDGIKLAVNVAGMLLVFTAFVHMINVMLMYFVGSWSGLNDWVIASTNGSFAGFNLEYILGVLFSPIAWLIGVPYDDILTVGQLLGKKTTINEFYAYAELEKVKSTFIHQKSLIITTYALCGFANFASIGIQLGGIGAIAPGQRTTLAKFGIKALIGGTVAAFMTAAIAGILVG